VIAQGQEPSAHLVREGEPSSEADLLGETFGRVHGRAQEPRAQQSGAVRPAGIGEPRAQQSEAVPTLRGLVGRGSPDPAPSPTEGLPIDQIATNEATTLPNCENATNEATTPREHAPRTIHVLPAIVVAFLALLLGAGISAAFGTSANATDPNSLRQLHFVEQPRILAEISTIPRDNRPRPLSSD
jgi:hypothetical protein